MIFQNAAADIARIYRNLPGNFLIEVYLRSAFSLYGDSADIASILQLFKIYHI